MANRIYPMGKINAYKKKFDLLTDPVKIVLIDLADYPLTNFATDAVLSDIPGAAIVGTAVALGTKTLVAGPSGDKIKFTSASAVLATVSGDPSEALLGYVEAVDGNYLLWLDDTATGTPGLPLTPVGVNVNVTAPTDGWFNF